MVCFQAVGTKLPHTSYKQSHNPVNTVVLKAYDLFGKAQNRMVNQQATRSWKTFVFKNSQVFLFPTFFSFYDFSERFNFLSSFLGDSGSFLCFPLKFFAGSWHAAGRNWPLAHARRLTVVYELTGCVLCVTCNLIYCDTGNMITMFLTYS